LESERDVSTKFPEGIVIHMLRDGRNPIEDEIDAFGDQLHVSMDRIHTIASGMNAILG